jgi:transposase-like protein
MYLLTENWSNGGADKNLDRVYNRRFRIFPHQERIKAVKLLVKYDMSYAGVTRELGYPTRTALTGWYKECDKDSS